LIDAASPLGAPLRYDPGHQKLIYMLRVEEHQTACTHRWAGARVARWSHPTYAVPPSTLFDTQPGTQTTDLIILAAACFEK
jgi:hypothetical protein